jgi:hypothetical protein
MSRLHFWRVLISCIALCAWTLKTTTPTNINPKNTKSEGVNVSSNISTNSEIERLSGEVKGQRDKAEFWDTWNIRLLWVAGIIALFFAITGVGVSRSNKRLLELSDQLEKAKDRALEADLKAKDQNIASLNEHAASLQVEALNLQKQILLQGPRANLLAGENRKTLVEALEMFPKQKVDVRRSAFLFQVNGKTVSSTPIGDDVWAFANAVIPLLRSANWEPPSEPELCSFTAKGIVVGIAASAPETTKASAKALVAALSGIMLATSGPMTFEDKRFQRTGVDTSPLDPTTIVLEVHPRE